MKKTDLTELKREALELFNGDENAAFKWLNTKLQILGNETPLEHSESVEGIKEVVNLIKRIEHGVLS